MSRLETIEGRPTLVVPSTAAAALPQKMPDLLGQLTNVTYRDDFALGGMATSCQLRDHRFRRFREGRHVGLDGVVRDVRLQMCADCGAVCVRDISFDRLPGLSTGRRGPARKDDVIGWYSGARRAGRTYGVGNR